MTFEIWNEVSGNAVGEFASVEEALAVVRAAVAAHGRAYAEEWALAVADDEDIQPIATGDALITLAVGTHGARVSLPA